MPLRPLCHAVVVGGSMAGLLATRVLADYFEHVTLIERDTLARSPEPRKGVPQGRHVHVLLLRGRLILDRLFPGLSDELRADGAVLANLGRDLGWHHAGGWRARFDSDLSFLAMSRPLLEFRVAERVRALPNAAVRDGVRVDRLHRDSRNTVAGVRLTSPGTPDRAEEIGCDLVVDATGRGSATPRWLAEQGFAPPREDLLPARVTYATCMFPRSEHGPEQQAVLVTGAPAKRSGGLFPIEGDRWLVTLASFFDAPTPHDYDSFLAFARSLDAPDIYTAIRDLRPLSAVAHYRFAGSLRRRYERLARLPDGLIVIGDGVCSFNPVYGQGMTVSAMEAECLARLLAEAQRRGGLAPDFERRWFRAITPVVDAAWSGVSLEDLLFPELARQRPARLRPLQWYMNRVHRATHRSPAVADQFYRVANFLDPATALFRPRIAADVLFGT
jgi:2-polyprenyl-6-methoxyphenol hydroxylase-like FAD-dependent oxidoreductase